MTWVLAQPSIFGYVIVVSDICVTLENPNNGTTKTYDCLQKVYLLTNTNIFVGFAGNIKNAFRALKSIEKYVKSYYLLGAKNPLAIEDLVRGWSEVARKYHRYLDDKRIELIFAAESLIEGNGLEGRGMGKVYLLKSPDYDYELIKPGRWGQIGSGSEVDECRKLLENHDEPFHPLLQSEVHNPFGYGRSIGMDIAIELRKNLKTRGISKHLQIATGSRASYSLGDSSFEVINQDGMRTKYSFPENICKSYPELKAYLESKGDIIAKFRAIAK